MCRLPEYTRHLIGFLQELLSSEELILCDIREEYFKLPV